MALVRSPAPAERRAGDSHHDRSAAGAGQLARLPVLEPRAGRDLICARADQPGALPRRAGGRLWVYGDGFPLADGVADDVTIGGVPARISFACPGSHGGGRSATASEGDDTAREGVVGARRHALRRRRPRARHRPPPGGQPRRRRQGERLRHLFGLARASRRRCRCSASRRNVGLREPFVHGLVERHVDGVRSRRQAVCVEPFRRARLPRARRRAVRGDWLGPGHRDGSGVRARRQPVRRRSIRHDVPDRLAGPDRNRGDAARQHGRVPSGDGSGRLALRRRRRRSPPTTRCAALHEMRPCRIARVGVRPAARRGVRRQRRAARRRGAGRIRAVSTR